MGVGAPLPQGDIYALPIVVSIGYSHIFVEFFELPWHTPRMVQESRKSGRPRSRPLGATSTYEAETVANLPQRIRSLRGVMNLTQQRFGALLQVSQPTVARWEAGRDAPADVHIERMAQLAGVSVGEFRYGPIELPDAKMVPVVGHVGAGDEIYPFDDHALGAGLEEVDCPATLLNREIVAVRVRGDSMLPLQDGWLLYFERNQPGVPERCLNELCVVKIAEDGPTLVKNLRRGYRKGRFNLESWNASTREDVLLDWAARVLMIEPR